MNIAKFLLTHTATALLVIGPMALLSFGQETLPKDPVSKTWPDALRLGDYTRTLMMGEQKRTYLVHVPKHYDPTKSVPVVLALHGSRMNGSMMVWFSGLTKKSDEAGFIVVYPNGTGKGSSLRWNAGGKVSAGGADDVTFIGKLLDDLGAVVKLDEKRIYACGMSNGGMMCYWLAAELSERIAAIAPVAGAIVIDKSEPKRPVPVIHFHGTNDKVVPFEKAKGNTPSSRKSVEESIQTWVKLDGCDEPPKTDVLSKAGDEMKVTRTCYGGGKDGSEVILVVVENGGHTWPGQQPPLGVAGKSAKNISANDLMWEFFQNHPMK
jgi:polyhydroxybutyrate depolymerase